MAVRKVVELVVWKVDLMAEKLGRKLVETLVE
jgi:hypothetical protein